MYVIFYWSCEESVKLANELIRQVYAEKSNYHCLCTLLQKIT